MQNITELDIDQLKKLVSRLLNETSQTLTYVGEAHDSDSDIRYSAEGADNTANEISMVIERMFPAKDRPGDAEFRHKQQRERRNADR